MAFQIGKENGAKDMIDQIFEEIRAERQRQNKRFGEQNHKMVALDYYADQYRAMAQAVKKYNDKLNASKERKIAWDSILLEEVWEALGKTEPEKQRKEMIQVAAVAVNIIECLDRQKEKQDE